MLPWRALTLLRWAQSTELSRITHIKAFNQFLAHQHLRHKDIPTDHASLTEVQANDKTIYERFAHWLVYHFNSKRKKPAELGTIKNYVWGITQILAQNFPSPSTRTNLSVLLNLPAGTNTWMTKLVSNMERIVVHKAFDEGREVKFILRYNYLL